MSKNGHPLKHPSFPTLCREERLKGNLRTKKSQYIFYIQAEKEQKKRMNKEKDFHLGVCKLVFTVNGHNFETKGANVSHFRTGFHVL